MARRKKPWAPKRNVKPRWSKSEENFIIENAGKMKDKDIAKTLKRSLKSIRMKRQALEINKKCGRGRCELEGGQKNKDQDRDRDIDINLTENDDINF